jgi:hypothetical protein
VLFVLFQGNLERKIISAKMKKKSAAKTPFATVMQALQYDLRPSAAEDIKRQ